ncbi:hypothetical protein OAR93_03580 [Pelagibacteraceae bacterium]|jgi:hypothetical protein|nr:hypothetical protein [Pelagibacteraceae bacterium]
MFGSKKKNDSEIQSETTVDNSNQIIIGVAVLFMSILLILIIKIYTASSISSQERIISQGKQAEKKSQSILIELGKIGKKSKEAEYRYLKELKKIMSPEELQKFKNSITGIASKNKVIINSIFEGKQIPAAEYTIFAINFEAISTFTNYVNFKKDLSKNAFKIYFEQETIARETPSSTNIKVNAVINAVVLKNKKQLLEKKKKFYEQMEKAEMKQKEKEAKLRSNSKNTSTGK